MKTYYYLLNNHHNFLPLDLWLDIYILMIIIYLPDACFYIVISPNSFSHKFLFHCGKEWWLSSYCQIGFAVHCVLPVWFNGTLLWEPQMVHDSAVPTCTPKKQFKNQFRARASVATERTISPGTDSWEPWIKGNK